MYACMFRVRHCTQRVGRSNGMCVEVNSAGIFYFYIDSGARVCAKSSSKFYEKIEYYFFKLRTGKKRRKKKSDQLYFCLPTSATAASVPTISSASALVWPTDASSGIVHRVRGASTAPYSINVFEMACACACNSRGKVYVLDYVFHGQEVFRKVKSKDLTLPLALPNSTLPFSPTTPFFSLSHSAYGMEPGVTFSLKAAKSFSATKRPCCCAAEASPGGPVTSPIAYTLFSEVVR